MEASNDTKPLDLPGDFAAIASQTRQALRVYVMGQAFDFDPLRLARVFPDCVIPRLAARSAKLDPDGVPVLALELDLQAMRTVYAFYSLGIVVVPRNAFDRDILEVTCDYLGATQLIGNLDVIAAACADSEPDGEEFFARAEEAAPGTTAPAAAPGAAAPAGDDPDYLHLGEPPADPSAGRERKVETRPACALTAEDQAILKEETGLRLAYGRGETPQIPTKDAVRANKVGKAVELPYTLACSEKGALRWVGTTSEFEDNLRALTFGIFEPSIPPGLVIAGGSALRCLTRDTPPPPGVLKEFIRHLPGALDEKSTYEEISSSFLQFDGPARAPSSAKLSPDGKNDLSRLMEVHGSRLRHAAGRHWNPMGAPVVKYFRELERRSVSDVDLFVVASDPELILQSIRQVYDRMVAVHLGVTIVRTENSITFYPRPPFAPPVQIILRVYNSLPHVLLGFDVDSCCIGFDGSRALCTRRFLRATRRGYNLVDVTRLSPSYETRLAKYLRRGFHIAMTEPALQAHLDQLAVVVGENPALAVYPALIGITRLAYHLLREWGLTSACLPRAASDDYSIGGLKHAVNAARKGLGDDVVIESDFRRALFGSVSSIPDWARDRRSRRAGAAAQITSTLGPVRLLKTNVTGQGRECGLFTGSFNPIQLAWYKGGVRLPDVLANWACHRPNPGDRAEEPALAAVLLLEGEAPRDEEAPDGKEASDGEGETSDGEESPGDGETSDGEESSAATSSQ